MLKGAIGHYLGRMSKRNLRRFLELIILKYGNFFFKKMASKSAALKFVISLATKRQVVSPDTEDPTFIGERLLYGDGTVVLGSAKYCTGQCSSLTFSRDQGYRYFNICPFMSFEWEQWYTLKEFAFLTDCVVVTATRKSRQSKIVETVRLPCRFGSMTSYEANYSVEAHPYLNDKIIYKSIVRKNIFRFVFKIQVGLVFVRLLKEVRKRAAIRQKPEYTIGGKLSIDPELYWSYVRDSGRLALLPKGHIPILTQSGPNIVAHAYCTQTLVCTAGNHAIDYFNVSVDPHLISRRHIVVAFYFCRPTPDIVLDDDMCTICQLRLLPSGDCPRCDSYYY
jgi:hypothetical protein